VASLALGVAPGNRAVAVSAVAAVLFHVQQSATNASPAARISRSGRLGPAVGGGQCARPCGVVRGHAGALDTGDACLEAARRRRWRRWRWHDVSSPTLSRVGAIVHRQPRLRVAHQGGAGQQPVGARLPALWARAEPPRRTEPARAADLFARPGPARSGRAWRWRPRLASKPGSPLDALRGSGQRRRHRALMRRRQWPSASQRAAQRPRCHRAHALAPLFRQPRWPHAHCGLAPPLLQLLVAPHLCRVLLRRWVAARFGVWTGPLPSHPRLGAAHVAAPPHR